MAREIVTAMNINDLMKLTGKTRAEVEAMLNGDDLVTLDLSEKCCKKKEEREALIEAI